MCKFAGSDVAMAARAVSCMLADPSMRQSLSHAYLHRELLPLLLHACTVSSEALQLSMSGSADADFLPGTPDRLGRLLQCLLASGNVDRGAWAFMYEPYH